MDNTDCPAVIKESDVSRRSLALRVGGRDCIAEKVVIVSSSISFGLRRCRFAMKMEHLVIVGDGDRHFRYVGFPSDYDVIMTNSIGAAPRSNVPSEKRLY